MEMDKMNFDFSMFGNVKNTGQYCPVHTETEMLVFPVDKEPRCPQCMAAATISKVEEETAAIANAARQGHDRVQHGILARSSVVQDSSIAAASFDNYIAVEMTEHALVKKAEKLLKVISEQPQEINKVFLQGVAGGGKSHMAMSMAKKYINDNFGKSAVFIDIAKMFEMIFDGFKKGEDYQYTQNYFTDLAEKVDLLVLDDLGAEAGNIGTNKMSSDFKSGVLRSILNARVNRPTIITTNLTSGEIKALYNDARLVSRIFAGAKKEHVLNFVNVKDHRSNVDELGF